MVLREEASAVAFLSVRRRSAALCRRPMTTLPIVVEAPSQGVLVQLIEARVRIARIEQAIKFAGYLDKALDFSLVLGSCGSGGIGITP